MGRTGFHTSFECIIRARDEGLAHPLWGVSVWAEIFGHIWLSLAIFTRKDLGWVGSTASLASSQPAEPGKCCTVHWMRWQHPASTASSRRLELASLWAWLPGLVPELLQFRHAGAHLVTQSLLLAVIQNINHRIRIFWAERDPWGSSNAQRLCY